MNVATTTEAAASIKSLYVAVPSGPGTSLHTPLRAAEVATSTDYFCT